MKKLAIISIFIMGTILLTAKTWLREYTYRAGEADSKLTSRAIALEQVKMLLLEEIGVYVHSELMSSTEEINGNIKELSSEKIKVVSAGVTETKIIEEKWNGETFYIKADAIIADDSKTKQLEDSQKRTQAAMAEIESLRMQLAKSNDEIEKLRIQKDYTQQSQLLTAEDWFSKGYRASEDKDWDNTILNYQKAIELKPDYAYAYNNIGLAYYEKGNDDQAILLYEKAIELKPDYAYVYNNLGLSYYEKGMYDKAIQSYRKALELKPDFADAYFNMGLSYNNTSNYDKAIQSYQKTIELKPDDNVAYNNMGYAYNKLGNTDKKIWCYQQAARLGNKECQEWLKKNGYSW
jgi:tetratricopeptide (TPR) repeat protein